MPADGSVTCATPLIRFTIDVDGQASSTAPPPPPMSGVRWGIHSVTLDGIDITSQGARSARPKAYPIFVWEYRPPTPLPPGRHEVAVAYGDGLGVEHTYRWAFEVQPCA